MSIFLVFCVLAAAGWLLLSVSHRDTSDRPDASVAAHSRAMAALGAPHDQYRTAHRSSRRRTRSRTRPGPAAHRRPPASRSTTRR